MDIGWIYIVIVAALPIGVIYVAMLMIIHDLLCSIYARYPKHKYRDLLNGYLRWSKSQITWVSDHLFTVIGIWCICVCGYMVSRYV